MTLLDQCLKMIQDQPIARVPCPCDESVMIALDDLGYLVSWADGILTIMRRDHGQRNPV